MTAVAPVVDIGMDRYFYSMTNATGEPCDIRDLLTSSLRWIKPVGSPRWISTCFGDRCELSLNDFPDEAMYTLSWRDEKIDFDDTPSLWIIPRA
jgi:hypothetical protein